MPCQRVLCVPPTPKDWRLSEAGGNNVTRECCLVPFTGCRAVETGRIDTRLASARTLLPRRLVLNTPPQVSICALSRETHRLSMSLTVYPGQSLDALCLLGFLENSRTE